MADYVVHGTRQTIGWVSLLRVGPLHNKGHCEGRVCPEMCSMILSWQYWNPSSVSKMLTTKPVSLGPVFSPEENLPDCPSYIFTRLPTNWSTLTSDVWNLRTESPITAVQHFPNSSFQNQLLENVPRVLPWTIADWNAFPENAVTASPPTHTHTHSVFNLVYLPYFVKYFVFVLHYPLKSWQ